MTNHGRFYLVCHKETGEILKMKNNATHWCPPTESADKTPRLFTTKNAAALFISYWSQGMWKRVHDTMHNLSYIESDPVANRSKKDLEIIEISLMEHPLDPHS